MEFQNARYDRIRAAGWSPVNDIGFAAAIGPFWTLGPEHFCFLVEDRHLNRHGLLHGGMLLAFADRFLSSGAPRSPGIATATIHLDMQFVAPCPPSAPMAQI